MIKSSRVLAGVAALAAAGVANAFAVPDFQGTDPSIGSPGYSDFWAGNAQATLTGNSNGTFTLSIIGNSQTSGCGSQHGGNCSAAIFNFPSGAYLVGNESINITANFSSTGVLSGGTYEIDGSLASSSNPTIGSAPSGFQWSTVPVQKLFSTSLTAVTVDSTDGALGFKTANFGGWANQQQFTGGSTSESLWLYAITQWNNSWNQNNNLNMGNAAWNSFLAEIKGHTQLKGATFTNIASIATVPIPGALWLFGSGLAALGARFRRRKAQA
jgi:hypothetical protein